jgi:hypothetical protein
LIAAVINSRRNAVSRKTSRLVLLALMVIALFAIPMLSSAFESSTCSKVKGTYVCTTTSGPGQNQGGVGTTTETTTQGNTTNFSPEPQGTGTTSSCKPNSNSANCS